RQPGRRVPRLPGGLEAQDHVREPEGVLQPAAGVLTFADQGVEELRAEVRAWLLGAIPSSWRERAGVMEEAERNAARRAWDGTLWDDGWAGVSWPAEYGGRGLGPVEQLVFYEELAIAHAPDELDRIGKFLTGPAVIAHGTEEQKERYLRPILAAEEL